MDKKILKIATASAMVTSSFVAVAPVSTEAAKSVSEQVKNVKKAMYKPYETVFKGSALSKLSTLENQIKAAEKANKVAKEAIKKSGGKKKAIFYADLKKAEKYITQVKGYVTVYKEAEKISKDLTLLNNAVLKQKSIKRNYESLKKNITTTEKSVKKTIYGTTVERKLIQKFIIPVKTAVNADLKVYYSYEIANSLVKNGDLKKAKKQIESASSELKKVGKKTNLEKAIQKYANKVSTSYNTKVYNNTKLEVQKQVDAFVQSIKNLSTEERVVAALQVKERIDSTKLNSLKEGDKVPFITLIDKTSSTVIAAQDAFNATKNYQELKVSMEEKVKAYEALVINLTNENDIQKAKEAQALINLNSLNDEDKAAFNKRIEVANNSLEAAKNRLSNTNTGSRGNRENTGNAILTNINAAGTYGSNSGSQQTINDNVTISAKNVTLQNVVIKGDLYITEDVADGDVFLKNVKVEGNTYVRGGGINSIHFEDSVLATVIVNKNDGAVRIVATGSTKVVEVQLESYAKIEEENLDSDYEGFTDVTIDPTVQTTNPDLQIELVGQFETINSRASQVRITLAETTDIQTLVLNTLATVIGAGRINTAEINATGSTISSRPANVVLNNGTVRIGESVVEDSYSAATTTILKGVELTQGSISVKLENYVAGLTSADFDIKATLDGADITLTGLEYNPNLQQFTFNPVVLTNNIGKILKVEVKPSTSNKLSGETVESQTEIKTGFSGRITDVARVGFEGATIKFRAGVNNKDGAVVAEVRTDKYGFYSVNLPAGEYTGEISGPNVVTSYLYATAPSDIFNTNQNETAIRSAASNELKILVNWGEQPEDVDSHLIGSKLDGSQFHVFYNDKTYVETLTPGAQDSPSETYVDLDWDDTDSYGPETTTLRKLKDGQYVFYLHKYYGKKDLRDSRAVVQIYKGNSQTPDKTFNIAAGEGTERYWVVFGLEISENGSKVDIIPVEFFDRNLNYQNYSDLGKYLNQLIADGEGYLSIGETAIAPDKKTIIEQALNAAKAINIPGASFSVLLTEVTKLKNILNLNTDLYPEEASDYYEGDVPPSVLGIIGEDVNEDGTAKYALKSNTENAIELYAYAEDANGNTSYINQSNIEWSSSNSDVATVDADGKVSTKAVTEDTEVTITATAFGVTNTIELTVSAEESKLLPGTLVVDPTQAEALDADTETPGIQIQLNGDNADEVVTVTFTGTDQYGDVFNPLVVTSESDHAEIATEVENANTVTISPVIAGGTKVHVRVGEEEVVLDVVVTSDLSAAQAVAQEAVDGLEAAVTIAEDAVAAQAKVDAAQDAVNAVKALNAEYNTAAWDEVIATQQGVVNAMSGLESAVSAAQEAIDGLEAAVTAAEDAEAAKDEVYAAQEAVDAVKALDAEYDTAAWDEVIATQQGAVNQLQVDEVAATVENTFVPVAAAVDTILLPTVPNGYTITVNTTSVPTVYDPDGKLKAAGTSNVVYTVAQIASGKKANTTIVQVTVDVTN